VLWVQKNLLKERSQMTEDEETEMEQQCAQGRILLRIVEKQLHRVQEQATISLPFEPHRKS
jgi:hypothetical protein